MIQLTRRDFLRMCGTSSIGLALAACGGAPTPTVTPAPTTTSTALPKSTPLPTATATLTSTPAPTSTATATATSTITATATPIPRTIGTLSSKLGIGFAGQARASQLSKPQYDNTLNSFNSVTFVDAHMVGWTLVGNSPSPAFNPALGKYNWAYFDLATDYSLQRGKPIQLLLHFVWGKEKYLPDWVKAIKDPKELEQVIESHIKTVSEYIGRFTLARYPYQLDIDGTPLSKNPIFQSGAVNVPLVQSVSVVNEPVYWQAASGQNDYFYQMLGERYIFKSFELARKYAPPGTLLLLNDTNMLGEIDRTANGDKILFEANLKIASRLKQGGLIDGLGFQMHTDAQRVMDVGEVTKRLQMVVSEGLLAIPTELDVHVHNMPGDENLKQLKQADTFEFWVRTFYEIAKCRMFSGFSLSDNDSWLRDSRGWTDANETLFDKSYKPKLSHDRLIALLEKLLAEKQKKK